VLYRLSETKQTVQKVLIASMALVVVATLVTFLVLALQCRPLSVAWGVGEGECMDGSVVVNIGLFFSAVDIFISWLYAVRDQCALQYGLGVLR
jgi:hypothetical protein